MKKRPYESSEAGVTGKRRAGDIHYRIDEVGEAFSHVPAVRDGDMYDACPVLENEVVPFRVDLVYKCVGYCAVYLNEPCVVDVFSE